MAHFFRDDCRDLARSYVDEATAKRWTDAQLNTHINLAIQEIHNELVSNGFQPILQTAQFTAASGSIDLTSLDYTKIVAVSQVSGSGRGFLMPIRPMDAVNHSSVSGTFELTYYENPTLPTSDSDHCFNWNDGYYQNSTLDQYCAVLTARNALVKDNEIRQGLELIRAELKIRVKNLPNGPGMAAVPSNQSSRSTLGWLEQPHGTVKLVNRR